MMDRYYYDYFDGGNDRGVDVAEEHRRRVLHQVATRIRLRDTQDPFAVSVSLFQRRYRIPQHMVMELAEILTPYVGRRVNERAVPLPIKILCALGFYASGSYQQVVGAMGDINICQASVSNFIEEITTALNRPDILTRFVHFPTTRHEREIIINRNARLGMPRVLGFIDGTLVQIVSPPTRDFREAYYCSKGYTALNVQLVVDIRLKIINVNAQFPGSCNDPYIYRASGIRDEMIRAYRESRCWLLGDKYYVCFRNVIERCNGVLKGRWRCLLSDRVLHYHPVKAGHIVNACAVLHNFCVEANAPEPRPVQEDVGPDIEGREEGEEAVYEEGNANEIQEWLERSSCF